MTKTSSLERAEIELTASMEEPKRAAPDPETPFRLLVVGDFSGRNGDGGELGFDRLPVRVDRDNLDEVLADRNVAISLPLAGDGAPATTFRFHSLDDFHPDRLLERTPAFGALQRTREQLSDPKTFADGLETLRSWAGVTVAAPPAPAPDPTPRDTSENVVAELLAGARAKASRRPNDLEQFVRGVAAGHSVPADDPRAPALVATVDEMIGSWIRNAMHHPRFQSLESSWRGLAWLARRLESDSQLQLWMLDLSKESLAADLRGAAKIASAGWHKILVDQAVSSEEPWSAVGALYSFERTPDDVALLVRLARVARAAGAPLIAEARPEILGCESFGVAPDPDDWRPGGPDSPPAALWAALRELPEVRWLGLSAPRFLLRLPYGPDTEPTERFVFEERDSGASHEGYLWGSPALVCLALLGEAFSQSGWAMRPGQAQEVDDLPLHVLDDAGQRRIQPPAEAALSPRAIEAILEAGIMPLVSVHGRDAIRLARFQAIAAPPAPLAGPWSA